MKGLWISASANTKSTPSRRTPVTRWSYAKSQTEIALATNEMQVSALRTLHSAVPQRDRVAFSRGSVLRRGRAQYGERARQVGILVRRV
jgi:hypothetical protein